MGTNTTTLATNRQAHRPRPVWIFLAAWADVWVATIFAGGACGALCAGVVTMCLFFASIPVGMILGAMLGLPLSLALAIPLAVTAPPQDVQRLTRRLDVVGVVLGLTVSIPPNLYLLAASLLDGADQAYALGLLAAANGSAAVYACALVGRECGHDVAARHLKRFGISAPPKWSPLNRRASTPTPRPAPVPFASKASDWEA